MDQTTWVIQVLDDSRKKSIEYQNRFWLRQNVEKMQILVCVEDCEVDKDHIEAQWKDEDAFVIQDGEEVTRESQFDWEREALLLRKYGDGYLVFLY